MTQPALLPRFSFNARKSGLDAKRVPIRTWHDVVHHSELGFPASEGEWMTRGRQRKDGMTSSTPWTVGWYFVEAGEPIPLNAIPTGWESGSSLFSIRVWQEGGLTLGKHGRHHRSMCTSTPMFHLSFTQLRY